MNRDVNNFGYSVMRTQMRLLFILWAVSASTAFANYNEVVLRPGDEIWVASTRHLDDFACHEKTRDVLPEIEILQYDAVEGWVERSSQEMLDAFQPDRTNLIYVHGNRVESHEIPERTRVAYEGVVSNLPTNVPVRMLVWSWPSDKIRGQLRDVRYKADRTLMESHLLSRVLARMRADLSVRVIGYSFGARIVTGALHLGSGGILGGLAGPESQAPRSYRVALFAAALGSEWLYEGGRHGDSLRQVERMINMFNSKDPVLKRYYLIERDWHVDALGYTGTAYLEAPGYGQVDEYDVRDVVGRTHAETPYFTSGEVMELVRDTLAIDDQLPVDARGFADLTSEGASGSTRHLP